MRLVVLAATLATASAFALQLPLDNRVVGSYGDDHKPIRITVPPNVYWLTVALDQIAASTQTVMGIEMREDDVPEGTPSPPDASMVLLTGMPLKNALDVLVNFDPFHYSWQQSERVVRFRRHRPIETLPYRPVNGFAADYTTPNEALDKLCDVLQPRTGGIGGSGWYIRSVLAERLFSVPTTDGALLESVLDEIVARHGAMNWHIVYPRERANGVTIRFTMFDGFSVQRNGCAPL